MDRAIKLLVTNVPVGCTNDMLNDWIEAHGFRTFGVRLIPDTVSGTSPSFAHIQLMDSSRIDEAARALDGQKFLGSTIQVQRVAPILSIVSPAARIKAVS